MKKQHKLFTAVAATAFCAVILTACGGQSAAPAAQQSTLQPATYSNTMPDSSPSHNCSTHRQCGSKHQPTMSTLNASFR